MVRRTREPRPTTREDYAADSLLAGQVIILNDEATGVAGILGCQINEPIQVVAVDAEEQRVAFRKLERRVWVPARFLEGKFEVTTEVPVIPAAPVEEDAAPAPVEVDPAVSSFPPAVGETVPYVIKVRPEGGEEQEIELAQVSCDEPGVYTVVSPGRRVGVKRTEICWSENDLMAYLEELKTNKLGSI